MKQKLTPTGTKVLKIVHLVCAIVWMGSAVIMNCLRLFVKADDAAGMFYTAEVLDAIDMKMLVPGAIGCLLTGLVYGLWTNWGFFRHRWLTVKWVLTIFMIALGTFYMGPLVSANVEIARAILDNGTGEATAYWQNVESNAYCGLLQLCLLTFVVSISVLKPWKKKKVCSKRI